MKLAKICKKQFKITGLHTSVAIVLLFMSHVSNSGSEKKFEIDNSHINKKIIIPAVRKIFEQSHNNNVVNNTPSKNTFVTCVFSDESDSGNSTEIVSEDESFTNCEKKFDHTNDFTVEEQFKVINKFKNELNDSHLSDSSDDDDDQHKSDSKTFDLKKNSLKKSMESEIRLINSCLKVKSNAFKKENDKHGKIAKKVGGKVTSKFMKKK